MASILLSKIKKEVIFKWEMVFLPLASLLLSLQLSKSRTTWLDKTTIKPLSGLRLIHQFLSTKAVRSISNCLKSSVSRHALSPER
jgi:hypothetical protein